MIIKNLIEDGSAEKTIEVEFDRNPNDIRSFPLHTYTGEIVLTKVEYDAYFIEHGLERDEQVKKEAIEMVRDTEGLRRANHYGATEYLDFEMNYESFIPLNDNEYIFEFVFACREDTAI